MRRLDKIRGLRQFRVGGLIYLESGGVTCARRSSAGARCGLNTDAVGRGFARRGGPVPGGTTAAVGLGIVVSSEVYGDR